MSVDLIVYLKRDKIPTHDPWQRAIDTEGFDLQLDAVDTVNQTGYWPAKLNGKDSGFEYSFGMAERWDEEEEEDELTRAVGDRDWIATFTTHSSLEEFQAASLAAAVLAKIADGVFVDPQSGDFAIGAGAFQLLQEQERQERERKMGVATQKWANMTQRRCPHCGAPCPEYRPRCFVCGNELGRA